MYTLIRVHGRVSICGIVWAGKDILESSDFSLIVFGSSSLVMVGLIMCRFL
jgi:hypothetical protein